MQLNSLEFKVLVALNAVSLEAGADTRPFPVERFRTLMGPNTTFGGSTYLDSEIQIGAQTLLNLGLAKMWPYEGFWIQHSYEHLRFRITDAGRNLLTTLT